MFFFFFRRVAVYLHDDVTPSVVALLLPLSLTVFIILDLFVCQDLN